MVVTHNGSETIFDCLISIRGLLYRNFELIVVDNGSEEDTVDRVSTLFPDARIICLS